MQDITNFGVAYGPVWRNWEGKIDDNTLSFILANLWKDRTSEDGEQERMMHSRRNLSKTLLVSYLHGIHFDLSSSQSFIYF
jgi:hypothetical protein